MQSFKKKDHEMIVPNIVKEAKLPVYSQALLCTAERKTCTNLSKNIGKSHDYLYQEFRNPIANKESINSELIVIAQTATAGDKAYLILDDSRLIKPHATNMEGVDLGFDGSSGRPEFGLQIITAMITNGTIKIPVSAMPYISKDLAGKNFKSKSQLAHQMYSKIVELFGRIDLAIFDAHFATKYFLPILAELQQNFLMKFTRTRVVTIGGKTAQLKKLLRLKKNQRIKKICGQFDGLEYFFYVAKDHNKNIRYFISLYEISHEQLLLLYKIRWNIELYHRTAKQYLGWKDCQMKSIEKQELHTLYVMYAYTHAELIRVKLGLQSTEQAIKMFRDVKPTKYRKTKHRSNRDLYAYA
jgi:hypothetical protein